MPTKLNKDSALPYAHLNSNQALGAAVKRSSVTEAQKHLVNSLKDNQVAFDQLAKVVTASTSEMVSERLGKVLEELVRAGVFTDSGHLINKSASDSNNLEKSMLEATKSVLESDMASKATSPEVSDDTKASPKDSAGVSSPTTSLIGVDLSKGATFPGLVNPITTSAGESYPMSVVWLEMRDGSDLQGYVNDRGSPEHLDTNCHGFTLTNGYCWINSDAMTLWLKEQNLLQPLAADQTPQIGDAVIWKNSDGDVEHSALYVGEEQVLQAAGTELYDGKQSTTMSIKDSWPKHNSEAGDSIEYWRLNDEGKK